jgi:rSAM/selenodomain-associated transferase 1
VLELGAGLSVAVAIVCKTPAPGQSKTRLSPPLHPSECAAISACFIQDLSRTIGRLAGGGGVTGYAVYTPRGSEAELRKLLPEGFELALQSGGDLGDRLIQGTIDLLAAGHDGVILVNSDSPTLPPAILQAAVDAVRRKDCVVLSPALDGGYTLVGLSKPHARLFADIPWSTSAVYQLTLDRAKELGLPVANVPGWYDVDDAASLGMLEDEMAGRAPAFSSLRGAEAPTTRRFLRERGAQAAGPSQTRSGATA